MGTARRRSGSRGANLESSASSKRNAHSRSWFTSIAVGGSIASASILAAVARWSGMWGQRNSSDKATPEAEDARLRAIFDPPRQASGYRIDDETAALLALLAAVAPAAAAKIRAQLQENPLQLGSRLGLCDALERHSRPSRPQEQRFAEFALCYRRFMEAFDFAENLPFSDARRQPLLNMQATAGKVAGDRMVTFSQSREDRLKDAMTFLRKGLRGGIGCAPDPSECLAAGANLLLASRLRGAGERELHAVFAEVRQTPGLAVPWPDPLSIHLQLPGIRQQGFWDPAEIVWLQDVAAQWRIIREELDQYIEERAAMAKAIAWEHQPESGYLAGAAQWNSVDLFMREEWREAKCRANFPKTCAMLRGRPELDPANFHWPAASIGKQSPPVLMVNIYQALPGAHIRPHFGTHGRLVASLGLRAPPGAFLQVGKEQRTWEEGRWLLFDDSFMHEVVNSAAEPRYVLAVAMLHPDCCAGC